MQWLPWEYAVRNMGRSPLRLALIVSGSALVVLLVLAAAGFVRGMNSNLQASGSPRNVLILAAGSVESVERSEISAGVPSAIASSVAGIRRTLDVDHISPEIHLEARLHHEPEDGNPISVALRGIRPEALLVHRQVRVLHGRRPETGSNEILVGRHALHRLNLPADEAALGRTLYFDGRPWTVAGVIASRGSVIDSEVWVPLDLLQTATRRDTLSCVVVTLANAELVDVEALAARRLDLEIVALAEQDYYAQVAAFHRPIQLMTIVTAALIAIGGLFGGLNTLYAGFAARVREFATLQTLGFPRRAILLSLVQEAVLAVAIGGLIAAAIALIALDGLAVRFAMGAIGLRIDSFVLAIGFATTIVLGLVGALPPAAACLRLPIITALKAT